MTVPPELQCPGEVGTITLAVCRARQQRHYEKCPRCPFADMDLLAPVRAATSTEPYEKAFKPDHVRGVYPEEFNEKMAEQIGSATARFLGAESLVLTRDMRLSGPRLSRALAQGILTVGSNVIDCGIVSTDASHFAISRLDASGGIQVTASHESANWNGLKISRERGMPMSNETGLENIQRIAMGPPARPTQNRGQLEEIDILGDFVRHVLSHARDPEALKVAVDAGNGMAGKMLPPILDKLPVDVTPLYFDLDGAFPNHDPDPLRPENLRDLRRVVREEKCDFGAAFDGDGDRVVIVDERGEVVPSDFLTALLAGYFLRRNRGGTILHDMRSSWVVAEEIRKHGGKPTTDRVGYSYMKTAMRQRDAVFGGGLSGHFYFRSNNYSDSGAIALVELLNLLSERRQPLSDLLRPLHRYYSTGELNFEVADPALKMREIRDAFPEGRVSTIDGVTVEFDDWWLNLRPSASGTAVRLSLEATTRRLMEEALKRVSEMLED